MAGALTYRKKEPTACPICGKKFFTEHLNSGGGRLITKTTNPDFKRIYTPSEKYGEVFPLVYPILVCPSCYYAAYSTEFSKLKNSEIDKIRDTEFERKKFVQSFFLDLDFEENRRLEEGVASCMLALHCYDYLGDDKVPSIRQGMSCLRGSWMLADLHRKRPDENFAYLSKLMMVKAAFFYRLAVECELAGKQRVSDTPGLGPDTDKNYGFDGVLYLYAYLQFNYGPDSNAKARYEQIKRAKNYCGRIFGMGKSNKEKPTTLLNFARDLYDEMGRWLKKHEADGAEDVE